MYKNAQKRPLPTGKGLAKHLNANKADGNKTTK